MHAVTNSLQCFMPDYKGHRNADLQRNEMGQRFRKGLDIFTLTIPVSSKPANRKFCNVSH